MEGILEVKEISIIQFQRSVIKLSNLLRDESLKDYPSVTISYAILASTALKKLFGVRMTVFDLENCIDTGIYFSINQRAWV